MDSLGVNSLLTNISLEETIDIYVDNYSIDNSPNIRKHDFRNLLNKPTKKLSLCFTNKYFKQVDVEAMASPLGPALANFVISSFESKWLQDCQYDFKPVFYTRYINDIFVQFSTPDHGDKFRKYLSSKNRNIKLSIAKEEDGWLPYLDTNIFP